ncbi:MAG: Gx transporter family protein [Clostridia bacterium]|nr:Gx transporter family protein [Clostridia bacterium]
MKISTGSPLKRLTADAMLIGAAMMISYLEAILPLELAVPLPGVKLGFANLAVMIAFFAVGISDAAAVSFIRVLLTGLLFGSGISMIFSALGALCAFAGLLVYRFVLKKLLSFVGASILCAALHNLGQLIAAMLVLSDGAVMAYAPVMLTASIFCGALNGVLLVLVTRALPEVKV